MTKNYFRRLLLATLCIGTIGVSAQVTVSSLDELKPYLSQGGVTVKLAPGIYDIKPADVVAGKFSNPLFLFEGNNSTYDFTGVTINIDTEVMQSFGNVDFNELQILGNNNVIKNLTMVDIGNAVPTKRAQNIVMDGQENRVEGFHMTVRGSYPYGYGDIFGKGGPALIRHHKHSALLIRGYKNHVKDCTIIDRAYGHAIFMQAADEPLIENCYIEGEMRSTDDILAEEGTGSDADQVNFESVWGYRLPGGYMISLQEAGIRAYDAGTTYINGQQIERPASNVTVLNCTVVNMRAGVALAQAEGTRYVEGTTVLGCENGFSIGSGDIVNCSGDAKHGPLFSSTYASDRGANVDLTVISSDTLKNGSGILAYIGGIEHDFTFRTQDANAGSHLRIQLGGHAAGVRNQLPGDNTNDHPARFVKIKSEVWNPIFFHEEIRNITAEACGFVFEDGLYNNVSTEKCDQINDCNNIASVLKATCYNDMSGITNAASEEGDFNISNIQDGDWSMYSDIDISDMNALIANVKSHSDGGTIEVRLDNVTGKLLTTLTIAPIGEGEGYNKVTENIGRISGVHDLYFVYRGQSNSLFDIEWFSFTQDVLCSSNTNLIEAECFTKMDGIQTQNSSEGSKNITSINDGNWTMYSDIDLTNITSVKADVASKSEGGKIEVYIDGPEGTKIAEISVTNTGGWQTYTSDSSEVVSTDGIHDVYLVFKGEVKYLFNLNSFEFSQRGTTTATVDILEDNPNIKVFPNPVSDRFVISNGKGTSMQLYNAAGELKLVEHELGDDADIDIEALSAGVYFLKISTVSESITRRIVKN